MQKAIIAINKRLIGMETPNMMPKLGSDDPLFGVICPPLIVRVELAIGILAIVDP